MSSLLLGPPTGPDAPLRPDADAPRPEAGRPIELSWAGPEGCPDAAWARQRVERFIGRPLDAVEATQLAFEVEITAHATGGWAARIVTRTRGGERKRRLVHDECAGLSEGAALVIALAIDPAAIDAADEATLGTLATAESNDETPDPAATDDAQPDDAAAEPAAPPDPKPPPDVAPAEAKPRHATPPTVGRWWAGPKLALSIGVGRTPAPDYGAMLGVVVGAGVLRIEAYGELLGPRAVALPGAAQVRLWAWAVGGRLGAAIPLAQRWELPLMAGVDVGQIRARGTDLVAARAVSPLVGHVHLVPGVMVWAHRNVGLFAEIDGFVPWVRPTFTVAGHGTVHRASPVGVHAGVGLVARFP